MFASGGEVDNPLKCWSLFVFSQWWHVLNMIRPPSGSNFSDSVYGVKTNTCQSTNHSISQSLHDLILQYNEYASEKVCALRGGMLSLNETRLQPRRLSWQRPVIISLSMAYEHKTSAGWWTGVVLLITVRSRYKMINILQYIQNRDPKIKYSM